MIIAHPSPTGFDLPLAELQADLHQRLCAAWDLATEAQQAKYLCLPRCHRNRKADGYAAELFTGRGYKDAYWDDKLYALSFFGVGNRVDHDAQSEVDVHLVFFVNLQKLKPGATHRADADVRKDVESFLLERWYGFTLLSTETGLDAVLKEYPGSRRDDGLKAVDYHPVHCFRLNLKLLFDIKDF